MFKQFYTCPTCNLKEINGDCEHKRVFNLNKDYNYFCSQWQVRKDIKPIYRIIAKFLVFLGYYNY